MEVNKLPLKDVFFLAALEAEEGGEEGEWGGQEGLVLRLVHGEGFEVVGQGLPLLELGNGVGDLAAVEGGTVVQGAEFLVDQGLPGVWDHNVVR